eukprot:1159946-Pelagomonas_calceolata.AAC.14
MPLLTAEKHRHSKFSEKEREWQLLRRGRYLEFNLLYDRGVRFGLDGGRMESIMVSAPPLIAWNVLCGFFGEPVLHLFTGKKGCSAWPTFRSASTLPRLVFYLECLQYDFQAGRIEMHKTSPEISTGLPAFLVTCFVPADRPVNCKMLSEEPKAGREYGGEQNGYAMGQLGSLFVFRQHS